MKPHTLLGGVLGAGITAGITILGWGAFFATGGLERLAPGWGVFVVGTVAFFGTIGLVFGIILTEEDVDS